MIAEALRESEAHYRRVFEQCNDSILIIDPANDQIVEANPQASTMLGFSPEELLATPISEIHPHDLADLFAFTETVFRRGTGRAKHLHCRTKTGDLLPVELSASVIELDKRPHILVLVRDLSESKRAEEALRESENQLRLITESVPALIAYIDKDQRYSLPMERTLPSWGPHPTNFSASRFGKYLARPSIRRFAGISKQLFRAKSCTMRWPSRRVAAAANGR